MSKAKLIVKGNRIACIEGCGLLVLKSQPICRKCRRKNKRRLAKIEFQERRQNAGYTVKSGYDE